MNESKMVNTLFNNLSRYITISDVSSEGFIARFLNTDFIFVKNNDDLLIFTGEEREFEGRVKMLIPIDGTTHINFHETKVYFKQYVIVDPEFEQYIKVIVGYLTPALYYQ